MDGGGVISPIVGGVRGLPLGRTGGSGRGPDRCRRTGRGTRKPLAPPLDGRDELAQVHLQRVEDLVGVVLGAEPVVLAGARVDSSASRPSCRRPGGSTSPTRRRLSLTHMEEPLSSEIVVVWRLGWLALSGRCRGGTSGRSSLSTAGSDSYTRAVTSRPGIRRGSPSKSGRGRPQAVGCP
jgi:hypothetical protein